ncbi:hypothetical protein B0H17DRAFT_1134437 [Mycena rosella]|uniref:Uncharacterized protein n=1 Tax=Mycena rosella TaxID=1033263 RepID=A0AAD7DHK4_MYCRO|nr:hypothetical protein B0H17DRAFT_1134437 [Mycena rosella]
MYYFQFLVLLPSYSSSQPSSQETTFSDELQHRKCVFPVIHNNNKCADSREFGKEPDKQLGDAARGHHWFAAVEVLASRIGINANVEGSLALSIWAAEPWNQIPRHRVASAREISRHCLHVEVICNRALTNGPYNQVQYAVDDLDGEVIHAEGIASPPAWWFVSPVG